MLVRLSGSVMSVRFETMPEEASVLVSNYTQKLYISHKPASPFKKLTTDNVLKDLEISRSQIANGEGQNMKKALAEMGKRHGYI